jgi:uncharacterized protein (TIGR02147 family)
MKSIYEYLDFRTYLHDYYESEKEHGNNFSYRTWSERAGFKARDFILRVIQGNSRLSDHSTDALARAMDLSTAEAGYFRELVRYDQAKTFDERERSYDLLHGMHVRFKPRIDARILPHDYFEFYSEWYHAAIRSIISSYEFSGDYAWLAEQVYPPVSVAKARKSVALLEKLGLVKRDASGRFMITDTDITTGDEVKKGALLRFYHKGMDLMMNALEKLPMDKRHVSGMTVGISEGSYSKIIETVKAFRQNIARIAKEEQNPDRVYQINVHAFPMSRVSGKQRGRK